MFKILFLYLFILIPSTSLFPQLDFQGINLGQSIENFENALRSKGFIKVNNNKNSSLSYKGVFEGEKCNLSIITLPGNNKVQSVIVYFDLTYKAWNDAKEDIEKWRERLSSRYGKPKSKINFEAPYKEGDGKEIMGVKAGKVLYQYVFNIGEDMVILELAKNTNGVVGIQLTFYALEFMY